jgi:hypothetical protein
MEMLKTEVKERGGWIEERPDLRNPAPYVIDDQLKVVLTVYRNGGSLEARLEAQVVGSDGMVYDRRATWILGRLNRKKNGNVEVVSLDRRVQWPSTFPVPRIWKDKEYGRKMWKFADWISWMVSPKMSIRGTRTIREICQQIYGQIDVMEVMGA